MCRVLPRVRVGAGTGIRRESNAERKSGAGSLQELAQGRRHAGRSLDKEGRAAAQLGDAPPHMEASESDQGLGFRGWELGAGVWGLGFGVWGLGVEDCSV
jgi:hypothetical protein